MNSDTWKLLEDAFAKWPDAKAQPVPSEEFDEKTRTFAPIDADYREFVLRYGGAIVGAVPIYGLRKPDLMGTIDGSATAPDLTRYFQERHWLGIEAWLIFSVDQGGNPVGFATDGTVWLSDQLDYNETIEIASGFEDYLLKWCLKVRPIT